MAFHARPRPSAGPLPPRRTLSWLVQITAAATFAVLWCLACNGLLTFWRTDAAAQRLVEHGEARAVFVLSSLILLALLLALTALTNRFFASCGLLLALALVASLADNAKRELRHEPVFPSDLAFLREPGFLSDMVSPGYIVLGLAAAVAVVVLAALVGRLLRRWSSRGRPGPSGGGGSAGRSPGSWSEG